MTGMFIFGIALLLAWYWIKSDNRIVDSEFDDPGGANKQVEPWQWEQADKEVKLYLQYGPVYDSVASVPGAFDSVAKGRTDLDIASSTKASWPSTHRILAYSAAELSEDV